MGFRRIELRVTPEQEAVIATAAESKGLPVAAWLRMIALEAARRQVADDDRHPGTGGKPQ
jgi:uncharacterized protein (DUF1778 family)